MVHVDKRDVADWLVFSITATAALAALGYMVFDFSALTDGTASRADVMRLAAWAFWLVLGGAAAALYGALFPDRQVAALMISVSPAVLVRMSGETPVQLDVFPTYAWAGIALVTIAFFSARNQYGENHMALLLERFMAKGLLVGGLATTLMLLPIMTAASDRLTISFIQNTLPYLSFDEICRMPGVICAAEAVGGGYRQLVGGQDVFSLFVDQDTIRTLLVRIDSPGIEEIRFEGFADYGAAMRSLSGVVFGMLLVAARITTLWVYVVHRVEMRKYSAN